MLCVHVLAWLEECGPKLVEVWSWEMKSGWTDQRQGSMHLRLSRAYDLSYNRR